MHIEEWSDDSSDSDEEPDLRTDDEILAELGGGGLSGL